jgi:hypothetical protein
MPRKHEKKHPLLSVSLWDVEILFDIGIRAGPQPSASPDPVGFIFRVLSPAVLCIPQTVQVFLLSLPDTWDPSFSAYGE